MKRLMLSIAAVAAMESFGMDYDTWAMESRTSPFTATSRCWRVTLSTDGNVAPDITAIESLPDNPDPSTLDSAGLLGMLLKANFPIKKLQFRSTTGDAVSGIKTIILSENTYPEGLELRGLTALTEIRTTSDKYPHEISVNKLSQEYAFENLKVTGAYVFKDLTTSIGKGVFKGSCFSDVRLKGSFSGFSSTMTFQNCTNLSYFAAESTSSLTALCTETAFSNTKLEYVYFPEVQTLGKSALMANPSLKEVILPSVTLFGAETGIGGCANLWNVVFGTTEQMTISGKNARSSFGSADNPRMIFNTKVKPTFSGSNYFLVDAATKLVVYVRKEAEWKSVNDSTHYAVVEESGGRYYWRSGTGVTGGQHELRFMDTAVKLNVQMNGVTVFTTILPGMSGEDAAYTVPKLMLLPPEAKMSSVQSLTEGVMAAISSDKQGIAVTVPATLFPDPSDSETKDLEVNVSVAQLFGEPGLTIIFR